MAAGGQPARVVVPEYPLPVGEEHFEGSYRAGSIASLAQPKREIVARAQHDWVFVTDCPS